MIRAVKLPFPSNRFGPGLRCRPDPVLALGFAVLGALFSLLVFLRSGPLYFFQSYMPEMVYSACGFGFLHPVEVPRPVLDFLLSRTTTIDCATLGSLPALEPRGVFAQMHLYLAYVVATLWRISSIGYRNLWPLISILGAAYASGCYVLLRLFFGRLSAVAGAIILTLSPVMLSMVPMLRDFSKGPFFIWSIVLLFSASRARAADKILLWAALAGTVVGAGYGFRSDAILLLPIGAVFLAVGLGSIGWQLRTGAVATFVAAALLFASPMWSGRNPAGFGTIFMEGISEPFRAYLDLGVAPYTLGQRYSDELALSTVAAELRPNDPEWDAHESRVSQGVTQAISRSGTYVGNWVANFSGDLAIQALKSASWIIGFPALVAPGRRGLDPGGWARSGSKATLLVNSLYGILAQPWLPVAFALGLVVFLWRVTAANPREALALFLMLGGLLTYPVVQFAVRHVFHLEFVWVVALLALLNLPVDRAALRRVAPRFALSCAIAAFVIVAARAVLIAYQDWSLHDRFDSLLQQPRELVTPAASKTAGDAIFGILLPDRYRALVEGPPDSMTNFVGEAAQWDVRAAADRLLLTVGGRECPAGTFNLSFQYAKRDGAWQPFDHELAVEVLEGQSDHTVVLVPAFYRPSQYFSGIRVPRSRASCILKIERITGTTKLPVILTAVLAPGWQDRSLHRAFGGFPVDRNMQ